MLSWSYITEQFFFYIHRPIPSLLMSWQLMEPGHQQERFWWCMMIGFLFCTSGIWSTCAASVSTILWKMELHFYVPQLKIQLVLGKIRTVGECMCHCTEPSWLAPYSMPSHYTNQFMPIHLGWDDNDKYSTKNYHIFFFILETPLNSNTTHFKLYLLAPNFEVKEINKM